MARHNASVGRWSVGVGCGLLAALSGGCLPGMGGGSSPATRPSGNWVIGSRPEWEMTDTERQAAMAKSGGVSGTSSGAARVTTGPKVVQVEVYICTLPAGAISRSAEFWKLADEQSVDVAAYDVLYRNGLRVGIVSLSAWPTARTMLEKYPVQVQQGIALSEREGRLDVPARVHGSGQTLGVFDARGDLALKTFDASENLLALSYQPNPTDAGAARVVVAPVVREQRERIMPVRPNVDGSVVSGDPSGQSVLRFVRPETFYDINLVVNVPYGAMLVVAPSDQASRATSIGYNFLTEDRASERVERVILIRPMAGEMTGGFMPKPVLLPPTPERVPEAPSAPPVQGQLPAATQPTSP